MWNKVTFRLPKTATKARSPAVKVRSYKRQSTWDKYSIVKYPLSSESAIKTVEDHNTLVFIVDNKANKHQIRNACQELY